MAFAESSLKLLNELWNSKFEWVFVAVNSFKTQEEKFRKFLKFQNFQLKFSEEQTLQVSNLKFLPEFVELPNRPNLIVWLILS